MKSSNISKAMLMAAGLGTRLQPFTRHRTKALMPVMGIPIAQFAIDSLIHAGVKTIVANVHHQAESTKKELLGLDHPNTDLVISDESRLLLGSAGGIREALPHFGQEPFFVSNADVLCDVDWNALAECHQRLRAERDVLVTWTVFPSGPIGGTYREILFDRKTNLMTGLGTLQVEKPYFIGAAVVEPKALQNIPSSGPVEFVPSVLEPAIKKGRAGVFITDGNWFDIGSPSLWLNTHLSLIDLFERGETNGKLNLHSTMWKKRVENINLRVRDQVWISKMSNESQGEVQRFLSDQWVGPSYWNRELNPGLRDPESFGPEAVLYGEISGKTKFSRGIGFSGEWMNLPQASSS